MLIFVHYPRKPRRARLRCFRIPILFICFLLSFSPLVPSPPYTFVPALLRTRNNATFRSAPTMSRKWAGNNVGGHDFGKTRSINTFLALFYRIRFLLLFFIVSFVSLSLSRFFLRCYYLFALTTTDRILRFVARADVIDWRPTARTYCAAQQSRSIRRVATVKIYIYIYEPIIKTVRERCSVLPAPKISMRIKTRNSFLRSGS